MICFKMNRKSEESPSFDGRTMKIHPSSSIGQAGQLEGRGLRGALWEELEWFPLSTSSHHFKYN